MWLDAAAKSRTNRRIDARYRNSFDNRGNVTLSLPFQSDGLGVSKKIKAPKVIYLGPGGEEAARKAALTPIDVTDSAKTLADQCLRECPGVSVPCSAALLALRSAAEKLGPESPIPAGRKCWDPLQAGRTLLRTICPAKEIPASACRLRTPFASQDPHLSSHQIGFL